MNKDKDLRRKDALPESVWAGDKIFPTWEAWQEEYQRVRSAIEEVKKFPGKLLESPQILLEWMQLTDRLSKHTNRLNSFARFASTVDSTDVEAKSAMGQAASLQAEYRAAISFAVPELVKDAEKLQTWAEKEPDLRVYAHFFDNLIRQKKHLRSEEVEEILSKLEEPFGQTYRVYSELVNTDLVFEDAVDTTGKRFTIKQSTLWNSLESEHRKRRKTAWENYYDGYISVENTLAANYIAYITQQVFLARVRGYESVLEMRLSPFNVPVEMFYNLIDTFVDKLPVWHRYWDIKRRALGLREIKPYDIWAPIGENLPVVPYTQAVEWICAALEPMGEEYVSVTRSGALEERWVDWAPNIEKRQGAASWRRYLMPPWIFMSYNDSVFSLSTLAHELGHSIHTYLASENQPEAYFGYGSYSSTVAETASNFNQVLTRAFLREVKKSDNDFMVAMVEEAMSNFHRYFFIMPTLARFELEVFTRAEEGEPLNVKILNKIMGDLFAEGYGSTMSDDPERTGITWATFLHLYMPFYTFQYAIGISGAHMVGNRILEGDQQAVKDYLAMLKAGGSLYTMDLFALAGIDMTTPEPVLSAFKVMEDNIAVLEDIVKSR